MSAAIRMTFLSSKEGLSLLSGQRVEMTLPPSAPVNPEAAQPEFLAELRRADGQVLQRTALPGAIEPHREAFSEEPGRTIHRVPETRSERVFTLLVPDHPEADHLALVDGRSAASGVEFLLAPRDILRVNLRDLGGTEPGGR